MGKTSGTLRSKNRKVEDDLKDLKVPKVQTKRMKSGQSTKSNKNKKTGTKSTKAGTRKSWPSDLPATCPFCGHKRSRWVSTDLSLALR